MTNIEKLIQLVQENPDLPVVAMVDSEIIAGDDYRRWLGSFGEVKVCDFFVGKEKVYTDKKDLIEDLAEYKYYDLSEEAEMFAKQEADKKMVKAIVVNIDLPERDINANYL